MLNDVWGLTRSPALAHLAAAHGCALVVMHNQEGTEYARDLMDEIKDCLRRAVERALAAGPVVRYEVPGLRALKFVAPEALGGGLFASLRAGMHWQKAAINAVLDLEVD
jgi:hypothetical protein